MLHFRMDLGQLFGEIRFNSHDVSESESGFHSDSASEISSTLSSFMLDDFEEINCRWAQHVSTKMQAR